MEAPEDQALVHTSQMLPRPSEFMVSSCVISRHRSCFLGEGPPQILVQKILASYNNSHVCAPFANDDQGHI